ncbi:MAG: YceI family protein [Gemmatimonadetes bacterium]|nr:YceI family protein [Gemmatimonadota bacterium]
MSDATSTATSTGTTWQIDAAHTHVEFAVKHMMISTVKGRFSGVKGTVRTARGDFTDAQVDVTIDVATLDTRQEQRDGHLRSADFFDAETYPSIRFVSKRVQQGGDGFQVVGDLTIRDVTREVTLDVTDEGRGKDPWGGERAGFSAKTRVDRREFGLTWNQALETGGILVGDDVKLSFEVELVKDAA